MLQDADRLFRRYMQALGWLGDPGLFELVRTHLIKVPVENVSAILAEKPGLPTIESFLDGIGSRDLGGDAFTINGYFAELLRYLDYDVDLLSGEADGDPFAHPMLRVVDDGVPYLVDVGLGAPVYEPVPLSALPLRVESGDWVYTIDHHSDADTFVLTTSVCGRTTRTIVVGPTPRTLTDFSPTVLRHSSAEDPSLRHLRITRVFAASRVLSLADASLATTQHNETSRRPLADLEALSTSVVEDLQLHNLPIAEAVEALRGRGIDIFAG
jgi:arylamine N-acetyltransferase